MVAASKRYRFICIIDPRCNPATGPLMESRGARVDLGMEPGPVDGFLGARLNYDHWLCASHERRPAATPASVFAATASDRRCPQ